MDKHKIWMGLVICLILISTYFYLKSLDGLMERFVNVPKITKVRTDIFPSPKCTRYEMTVNLDAISHIIAGTSVIETKNTTGDNLDEVFVTTYPNAFRSKKTTPAPGNAYYAGFDPGWLSVSIVTVNGKPAQYKDLGITGKIIPGKPLKKNEKIHIEMVWKAKIPRAAYRYGYKDDAILLGHFYPILNVKDEKGWHSSGNYRFGDPFYLQCADYMVILEIPEHYQIASTGSITSSFAEDNGRQTLWIEAHKVRDFALAALYNYQISSKIINGSDIKCYSRHADAISQEMLERSAASLKYYGAAYGSYPYPELNIVEAPMKGFQGMEFSGLIFLAEEVFQPDFDDRISSTLIAHEVAHQWWYGLVGNDQINEPWLDEGLATWSANQYLRQVELRAAKKSSVSHEIQIGKSLDQMGSQQNYFNTAYLGGEAFWYGLETKIGQEQVIKILRAFLLQYKYRTATTRDLRQVITQETDEDLEPFFESWFAKKQS